VLFSYIDFYCAMPSKDRCPFARPSLVQSVGHSIRHIPLFYRNGQAFIRQKHHVRHNFLKILALKILVKFRYSNWSATCHVWARGNSPLIFSFPHFPTFYCIFQYLLLFPFPLSYSLCLFSCFFIPFHSTRIVPLCFQAGCRRRQLNLALGFLVC